MRYAQWIQKQLHQGKQLKLTVYSEDEYQLVTKALQSIERLN